MALYLRRLCLAYSKAFERWSRGERARGWWGTSRAASLLAGGYCRAAAACCRPTAALAFFVVLVALSGASESQGDNCPLNCRGRGLLRFRSSLESTKFLPSLRGTASLRGTVLRTSGSHRSVGFLWIENAALQDRLSICALQ